MTATANCSDHARNRGRKRLGLSVASVERMAEIALEKGVRAKDATGRLRRYFDKLFLAHRTANNARIYGETVFIFAGSKLVTVFSLPNNLKALAKAAKEARTA